MVDRGWRMISFSFGYGMGIVEVLRLDKCVFLDGKNMLLLRIVLKCCGLKKKYSEL